MKRLKILKKFAIFIFLIVIYAPEAFGEVKDPLLETLRKTNRNLSVAELRGEKHYQHYCAICHGVTGKGDGFNASNLDPRPRNLSLFVPQVSDKYLFKVITEGSVSVGKSPLCPPWGKSLEKEKIQALISYLRNL